MSPRKGRHLHHSPARARLEFAAEANMLKTRSNGHCFLLLLALLTTIGTAAVTHAEAENCESMLEIRDCLAINLDRAQADIATLMQKTRSDGAAKLYASMEQSQQTWLKFRDSQCGLEAIAESASGTNANEAAELATHSCLTRMTEERALTLRSFTPLAARKNAARHAR